MNRLQKANIFSMTVFSIVCVIVIYAPYFLWIPNLPSNFSSSWKGFFFYPILFLLIDLAIFISNEKFLWIILVLYLVAVIRLALYFNKFRVGRLVFLVCIFGSVKT